MGARVIVLFCNVVILCVALAGILGALTGNSWWKLKGNDKDTESGLLKDCTELNLINRGKECKIKGDLFDFDGPNKVMERSTVLVLLIGSSGFLFMALVATLNMFCCHKVKGGWTCGAVMANNFALVGALSGVAAIVICEVKFKDEFKAFDRGWSNIVGWVGAIAALISYGFSFASFCLRPKSK